MPNRPPASPAALDADLGTWRAFAAFLALTFGLTWGLAAFFLLFPDSLERAFGPVTIGNPVFHLAVWSPAIAALVLVAVKGGRLGLKRYAQRLLQWRAQWGWYALVVLGIPAAMVSGAVIAYYVDGRPFTVPLESWSEAPAAILLALILGPVEELGWRGYALPVLQRRFAPLAAGVILGLIWGVWHIPAFLIGSTVQSSWALVPYLAGIVFISLIVTALFNGTRGSILLPVLFHWQTNNPLLPDAQPYDTALCALAFLLFYSLGGRRWYRRESASTSVIMQRD